MSIALWTHTGWLLWWYLCNFASIICHSVNVALMCSLWSTGRGIIEGKGRNERVAIRVTWSKINLLKQSPLSLSLWTKGRLVLCSIESIVAASQGAKWLSKRTLFLLLQRWRGKNSLELEWCPPVSSLVARLCSIDGSGLMSRNLNWVHFGYNRRQFSCPLCPPFSSFLSTGCLTCDLVFVPSISSAYARTAVEIAFSFLSFSLTPRTPVRKLMT